MERICVRHRSPTETTLRPDEHCPDDVLEEFLFQRLSPPDTQILSTHLAQCEHCQDQLNDIVEFVAGLRLALLADRQRRMPDSLRRLALSCGTRG
jgi:hypothetical protein